MQYNRPLVLEARGCHSTAATHHFPQSSRDPGIWQPLHVLKK